MSDIIGKTCPYCQFPVKPDEPAVVCSHCGLAHHERCWQANGRCTTYGCDGQPLAAEAAPPPLPGVPADMSADTVRCPACGLNNPLSAQLCKGCGASLEAVAPPPARTLPVSYPRAPRLRRFVASILDTIIGGCVDWLEKVTGPVMLLSVINLCWNLWYSSTKDGWGNGRSLGKRALGLMVVDLATNRPCTKVKSFIRQIVFYLAFAPMFFVLAWDLILSSGAGKSAPFGSEILFLFYFLLFAVGLVECCLALFSETGRRMGDRMAGTQVIEYREYRP